MKSIYVGNLPFAYSDNDLSGLFQEFGEIKSAKVVMDRESGRSKGFGFVEMDDDSAALQAIERLNGLQINNRAIRVNEAQPREARPQGGGFGGGSRGGFGGGAGGGSRGGFGGGAGRGGPRRF
jgi:cold-inducible RNA-binding protein